MASKKIYSLPVPPKIDETEDWLRELQMWHCVTDIEEKKPRQVAYLSLTDKIHKSCCNIKVSHLKKNNG